jgi:transposase
MASSKGIKSYSPEFKAEAVRLVIETSRPIEEVARELGLVGQTLGNWVRAARRDPANAKENAMTKTNVKVRQLEKQLKESQLEVEFLKKAAAYFATTQQ